MRTTTYLSILTIVLITAVPAAGADMSAGKPFDVTPSLTKGDQRWPSTAFGKDVYLVVWQEGEAMDGVKDTNIFAARVSAEGKPLDGEGIPVCQAPGFQAYPMAAFDGENFVVAWQDYRPVPEKDTREQDWDLYAARVSPEGKVLDTDGFAVAAVAGNQIYPALASNGKGETLIVWSDVRAANKPELYRLYGTTVRGGKPKEPGGRELAKGRSSLLRPYVAWDGVGYGIVAGHAMPGWSPAHPYGVRVGADGTAKPWKIPHFLGQTYSLAADPEGKRAYVWSNARHEHGSYCTVYLGTLIQDVKTGAGVRSLVNRLQGKYPPRNDLWCAAAFNGKNFVAVIEQSPGLTSDRRDPGAAITMELAAFRIDPSSGAAIDAGSAPAGTSGDLRRPVKTTEYKESAAKPFTGVKIAEENLQLRHPSIASAGEGKCLLVYSRHGGVGKYKIHAAALSE
ncbi:hypothetical protein ACFL01_03695 [Planctomycetota bacterium]